MVPLVSTNHRAAGMIGDYCIVISPQSQGERITQECGDCYDKTCRPIRGLVRGSVTNQRTGIMLVSEDEKQLFQQ